MLFIDTLNFFCSSAQKQHSTHHDIMALHLRLLTRQLVTFKLQTGKKKKKKSDMFNQTVLFERVDIRRLFDSLSPVAPLLLCINIVRCFIPPPASLAPPSSPFYPTLSASSLLLAGPDWLNTAATSTGMNELALNCSQKICSPSQRRGSWSEMSKHGVASQFPSDPAPVTAISCNHVSADVPQGDSTKESASTSRPRCQIKMTKNSIFHDLTDAAG